MTTEAPTATNILDTKANISRAASQAYIDQHAHCACGAWLDGRNLYVSAVTKAGKVTLVCWICEATRRGVIKHEYLNP